jgi:hypothetical protein
MEGFSLIEQNEQGSGEKVVQTVKTEKKRRSAEEKIGRIKHNQVMLRQCLTEIAGLRAEVKVLRNAMESAGWMRFSAVQVQGWSFGDKVDEAIFDLVKTSGENGMFPKDVAAQLCQFDLAYYDVSRRMVRMNRRLKAESGHVLFEKVGHKWALTRFAFEMHGNMDLKEVGCGSVFESAEARQPEG